MLLDEKLESLFRDDRFSIAKQIYSSTFRSFRSAIRRKNEVQRFCKMLDMKGKNGQPAADRETAESCCLGISMRQLKPKLHLAEYPAVPEALTFQRNLLPLDWTLQRLVVEGFNA